MAAPNVTTIFLAFVLAATVIPLTSSAAHTTAIGGDRRGGVGGWGKVGGITEVKDVEENKEVQQLGSFAVDEYNRRLGPFPSPSASAADRRLVFEGVVRAQTQVVSGFKYFLRLATHRRRRGTGGAAQYFDAVVVVKPWLESRELLSFVRSSPPASIEFVNLNSLLEIKIQRESE